MALNFPEKDDTALVIVCQGKPWCELDGEQAVRNQENGCTLCKRIEIDLITDEETIIDPLQQPN